MNAQPTYDDQFNIDHVISDDATGTCYVPGVSPGHDFVLGTDIHFDHKPIVCSLQMQR